MSNTVETVNVTNQVDFPDYLRAEFTALLQAQCWIGGFALLQFIKVHGNQGLDEDLLRLLISRAPIRYRAIYIIDCNDPSYPNIDEILQAGVESIHETDYKFQHLYTKLIYEIVLLRKNQKTGKIEAMSDLGNSRETIRRSIQHSVEHFLFGQCDDSGCSRGINEKWRKLIENVDICLRNETHRREST